MKYTLTLTQVAEFLGLHKGNVQAYKKQGKLESGRYNDYHADSILKYLDSKIVDAEKQILYLRSQKMVLQEQIDAHDQKEAAEAHQWLTKQSVTPELYNDWLDWHQRNLTPRQNELLDELLANVPSTQVPP